MAMPPEEPVEPEEPVIKNNLELSSVDILDTRKDNNIFKIFHF